MVSRLKIVVYNNKTIHQSTHTQQNVQTTNANTKQQQHPHM